MLKAMKVHRVSGKNRKFLRTLPKSEAGVEHINAAGKLGVCVSNHMPDILQRRHVVRAEDQSERSFPVTGLKRYCQSRIHPFCFTVSARCILPMGNQHGDAQACLSLNSKDSQQSLRNNFERQSCPTPSPQAPPPRIRAEVTEVPMMADISTTLFLGAEAKSVSDHTCHLRVTKLVAKRTLTHKAAITLSLWLFCSHS